MTVKGKKQMKNKYVVIEAFILNNMLEESF